MNRNAAGIDLGATVHYVAVPPGRDPEGDVRYFETFTADLQAIADWLERCGVETVAMESTGVYWIPLYDLLEQRGFEVLLINPADFKKFRRKTDVSDCQWLQTLPTFGLLRGSFRPDEKIVTLRAYLRHRDNLALQGNWREEHLFALRQGLELYEVYLQKLADLDQQLEAYLQTFEDRSDDDEELDPSHRSRALEPKLNLRDLMYKMTGVDLTEVDGIAGNAALQIVGEIGTDMSKWETDKHFVSWLCLCPELHLSGGSRKSKGSRTQPSKNRVAGVLRMCAQSLLRCDCALGAFGRRLRAKKGGAHAVTAMARKLAIIVYHMLKERRPYKDQGAAYYEARYRDRLVEGLRRRAKQLGLDVVPLATAP